MRNVDKQIEDLNMLGDAEAAEEFFIMGEDALVLKVDISLKNHEYINKMNNKKLEVSKSE